MYESSRLLHQARRPRAISAISPPIPNPVDASLGNTHSPIAASRSKPLGRHLKLIFNSIKGHWLGPKPPPWGSLSPLLGGGGPGAESLATLGVEPPDFWGFAPSQRCMPSLGAAILSLGDDDVDVRVPGSTPWLRQE